MDEIKTILVSKDDSATTVTMPNGEKHSLNCATAISEEYDELVVNIMREILPTDAYKYWVGAYYLGITIGRAIKK